MKAIIKQCPPLDSLASMLLCLCTHPSYALDCINCLAHESWATTSYHITLPTIHTARSFSICLTLPAISPHSYTSQRHASSRVHATILLERFHAKILLEQFGFGFCFLLWIVRFGWRILDLINRLSKWWGLCESFSRILVLTSALYIDSNLILRPTP